MKTNYDCICKAFYKCKTLLFLQLCITKVCLTCEKHIVSFTGLHVNLRIVCVFLHVEPKYLLVCVCYYIIILHVKPKYLLVFCVPTCLLCQT